jgi:hypothetical protein
MLQGQWKPHCSRSASSSKALSQPFIEPDEGALALFHDHLVRIAGKSTMSDRNKILPMVSAALIAMLSISVANQLLFARTHHGTHDIAAQ